MVAGFAIALAVARLLAGHFWAFYQNDEILLAAGSAAIANETISYVYRYGPQAGYYQLVRALSELSGGVGAIPGIMVWLSALAGTAIPICGLFMFRDRLTRAERLVLAGILTVNPILWMSSTYGNSAMPSVALLVAGITILSNRTRSGAQWLALGLVGAAIVVRADAVLATPAIMLLLRQQYGTRVALTRLASLGAALAVLYGVLFLSDPHMRDAIGAVKEHLTASFLTRFWDYLLWSTSPVLLALAILGGRELVGERKDLLLIIAAWCIPFFGFYYASTTSPRYFIPTAAPIAICSAVGFVAVIALAREHRRRVTAVALGLVASLHLWIGLSHFRPAEWRSLLSESQFETHVGPLWTGALVYKSYWQPEFLGRSIRYPGFGRAHRVQWSIDSSLASIAAGGATGRTMVYVSGGWNGHVFHYYTHLHGARYVARARGPEFDTDTRLELGGATVLWISPDTSREKLPTVAGDEVLMISPTTEAEQLVRNRLADTLTMVEEPFPAGPWLRRFRVSLVQP